MATYAKIYDDEDATDQVLASAGPPMGGNHRGYKRIGRPHADVTAAIDTIMDPRLKKAGTTPWERPGGPDLNSEV